MKRKKLKSDRSLRAKLRSPGRPPVLHRAERWSFWKAIARGHTSAGAAAVAIAIAGVAQAVATRWFRPGLEGAPGVDHAVGAGGLALDLPVRRRHVVEPGGQHRPHLRRILLGADVPGEADQVTPVAVVSRQGHGGVEVEALQRLVEAGQPVLRLVGGGGGGVARGIQSPFWVDIGGPAGSSAAIGTGSERTGGAPASPAWRVRANTQRSVR